MTDNFTRIEFDTVFNIKKIITLFYMEISKDFSYKGEAHDFWEMVYIDKGEVICTADKNRFTLKSGEITFHRPNEFHNLEGNKIDSPNVSIITFECSSKAMENFNGKIFKLTSKEKEVLSMLFSEGLSCYKMEDETNPLIQKMFKRYDAPFGSSQMTKNLLEIFLIMISRNCATATKVERKSYIVDGIDMPYKVKQIIDYLKDNIYGRVTIGEIAKATHQSESSVKQTFLKYFDGGIIRYYNQLKIEEARRLIRNGGHNFTQISDFLFFESPQYFSKCFKAFTKMTPSEYKKSIIK